jgi:microcystin-dependent protein
MWPYSTPVFDDTDPLVCHEIRLRPSLWAVLFNELQLLGTSRFWEQVDPSAATVDDVIAEINKATDEAVFAGCILIGSVTWLATACPDYALVCDGTTYLKADYPELWAVIDAAYEVDEDNFRVPDLIARFPLGSSSYAVQGGEDEHTLIVDEIPSHNHAVTDADITGLFVAPGEVPAVIATTVSVTGSSGGGDPHNNMPPYETLLPVIIASFPGV